MYFRKQVFYILIYSINLKSANLMMIFTNLYEITLTRRILHITSVKGAYYFCFWWKCSIESRDRQILYIDTSYPLRAFIPKYFARVDTRHSI